MRKVGETYAINVHLDEIPDPHLRYRAGLLTRRDA